MDPLTSVATLLKNAGMDDEVRCGSAPGAPNSAAHPPSASQFAAVREAAQRLLQARRDLEIHQEALSRLQHGYRPSGEATDFEAELRGHADAAAASKP